MYGRLEKMQPNDLLTVDEVITLLRIGRSTLYQNMKKGLFPKPIHLTSRTIRFLRKDIMDWLESKTTNKNG